MDNSTFLAANLDNSGYPLWQAITEINFTAFYDCIDAQPGG